MTGFFDALGDDCGSWVMRAGRMGLKRLKGLKGLKGRVRSK